MTYGRIIKLVRTYGSRWGRIRPNATERDVFFNQASLPDGADFAALREGQVVEFEEEPDRANGTHAVRITLGELPGSIARRVNADGSTKTNQ
jgi:cold shock CspA family protein